MDKKTIGIIGGMGPLATADLFKKIVMNTKAENDREHIRIFIDNNTNIPDRTDAILRGGVSPVRELTNSAVNLEKMGADFLIMPCNTAHYFYDYIRDAVSIPILNMINITCNKIKHRGIGKVALLATDGTIKSRIYSDVFEKSGVKIIYPKENEQPYIMDMIYNGVKAGRYDYDVSNAKKIMEDLLLRGAEILIFGCTEIPVAVEMYKLDYPGIDPTLELAKEAINYSGALVI